MNRRGFMGMFAALGLTGPSTAAKMTADISGLNLKGVGLLGQLAGSSDTDDVYYPGPSDNGHRIEWATKQLAKLAMRSALDSKRKSHEYDIHRLDANTYALRSVSLVNKMRWSQRKQFDLEEEREKIRLNRIIMGFED